MDWKSTVLTPIPFRDQTRCLDGGSRASYRIAGYPLAGVDLGEATGVGTGKAKQTRRRWETAHFFAITEVATQQQMSRLRST
jgi:hypothetical protein